MEIIELPTASSWPQAFMTQVVEVLEITIWFAGWHWQAIFSALHVVAVATAVAMQVAVQSGIV